MRRFASPYPGYRHGTPKCRALPVEPHPDIHFSAMIPRRAVKIMFFLSVVIPVVKAAFVPFSAAGGKPAIARVVRPSGLLSKPRMDRVYALPKQARYQLRYTRLLSFLSGWSYSPKPGAIPTSLYPDKDTPPASGRRIYYTSFFLRLQGKNLSWCLLYSGGFSSLPDYSPSAAFSSSTRSVFSQATPRSSRPMWP